MEVEDDNQDGPFTVWQMFNAPTMVLFNNLEHAADGLERLLTSILKLSGDFSEVLVPRPGPSKYPDEYYKAFNTWLIGRLFYVWSVEELNRIHTMSKDAQLKILSTLCINNALFYENLHSEYIKMVIKLIEYYKDNANATTLKEVMLGHFDTEGISIPNAQLNLESIFVTVKDIKTCETLLKLLLNLLSESIPMNACQIDRNDNIHKNLYRQILYMLEHFNVNLKLACLSFFGNLISNNDRVSVIKFSGIHQDINSILFNHIESFVVALPIYYEKCEIDAVYMVDLSRELLNLLKAINGDNDYPEYLLTINTVILDTKNSKLFGKDLKMYCLSLHCVNLQNKDSAEIELLKELYASNIIKHLKCSPDIKKTLKENWHYIQVCSIVQTLNTCEDLNVDDFIIAYHLKRCCAVLTILQQIWLGIEVNSNIAKEFKTSVTKDICTFIWSCLSKMIKIHKKCVLSDKTILDTVLSVILGTAILMEPKTRNESITVMQLICIENNQQFQTQDMNFSTEIKAKIASYLLVASTILGVKLDDPWKKRILAFASLGSNRSSGNYLQEIKLCPLLMLDKLYSDSKVISEVLLPAFLTKSPKIQQELCNILPAVACMSLGCYAIVITDSNKPVGHHIFSNGINISVICSKCHNTDLRKFKPEQFLDKVKVDQAVLIIEEKRSQNDAASAGQKQLFAKFLNCKAYTSFTDSGFLRLVETLSNHGIFNEFITSEVFNGKSPKELLIVLRKFVDNISADESIDQTQKESMINICINRLVYATRTSLENNEYHLQTFTLDCIKEFGLSSNEIVLLPSTKLLVYFIMHPHCSLSPKAVIYLRDICEGHDKSPNQVYHRYKKDYCRLFVDCSLYNGKDFAISLLKVVRAFGFVGYRDFISKDVHHFLPYLIPYSVKLKEIPSIIEEIASLVQCSVSDFLIEKFPHVYTHIYLYESDAVSTKCYEIIEKLTKTTILSLIKRHFRVILTEFLLQYYCNPEKVLNACRYLASHDPDVSTPTGNMTMTTSQIADFLQPKFLGVLAYFDHKLVNAKVALSVKRKALQSFPDIMKLMGSKYLTPLRFKVLATLRSALTLAKEFPKILAAAWSAFIHNIDSISLGPLLANLAVSLLQQFEYAPHEINKIFQYLVLSNENLLCSHISDLFFLEDSNISERVKVVIKKHVKRMQPEGFLDKVAWYLQHLNHDIPTIKAIAFSHLDKLLKNNRSEIHKAIFGGKNIDPVIVDLIDCLLSGCKEEEARVRLSSGACLGQLGAVEAGHLPRRYVQPDRSPFAFTINDDCFAATALIELTRAFQYEKDTTNMDCYALTIQEILKIYNISPDGDKKEVWDSFPEHMHQIMFPLLSSRYTLAYPSQPKKAHPLFGSAYASSFLEWAHNWAGQLIPIIEAESIRELLRTVHPSMRRDVRTLFLFLPYVLLHAIMSKSNPQYIYEEIQAVIGLENFENDTLVSSERAKYKLLRHIRMTPSVSTIQAEEGNQSKCSKMIYTMMDFLNRWLLQWCNTKQNPLQNENYRAITSFLQKFDKLMIARGNFLCGEFERALQYLELYMDECKEQMQEQLPFLAEIYALLEEPDSVAGILTLKRSEPSLKELILAQVVTGRLQDAALCYERLAEAGQLDRHSLQGMIDCYLSLDQPFTAYRLLAEHESADDGVSELAAEPLWRLGRFEQLDELLQKPVPPSRENWGLLMGRVLLSFRRGDASEFEQSLEAGTRQLTSQIQTDTAGESALRGAYPRVLALHVLTEARHAERLCNKLKALTDDDTRGADMINQLLDEWRRRLSVVQSDVRTVEPLLRIRRILLQLTQEFLQHSHPITASKLKASVGDLWLQSAKQARKAGIFQQSYMYILNAEEYQPEELFVEKAKMYWARGQQEQAFTTLKRGIDDSYPQLINLNPEQRKICAKAKLLIAKYNDETTNVDVDVNIGYYKEAVDVFKQWEKSLVCLGAYFEKVSAGEAGSNSGAWSRRVHALNNYGKALQFGHKYLYQSMPRMLSVWLDVEVTSADPSIHTVLAQMTDIIKTYSERLPLYLYLTAFSQIVSRICHPVKEVYLQLKAIIVKLILAYPQHSLWMMMSVINSSYPQRHKRCQDVLGDPRLKVPQMQKLVSDFKQIAEKLIELCNKPIAGNSSVTTVSALVRLLPRLLAADDFSHIMMPFQEFCKIVLPSKAARQERIDFNIPSDPPVYIAGIEEQINILPSLQKPRKVTLKGSDGKAYIIMLKPRDDLRKDYRLMEFNGVVNRFLQDAAETRRRRLYIRTYSVLPLNEECGLIEWVPNLVGLRPVLMHIYKQKGIHTSNRELKELMCSSKDPMEKKRRIYVEQLLPKHPPVFQEWFRRVFSDPYGWYQARSAYTRTTAVMSMVGYILGLGDRHGENISFDSTNGDTVHVDFNCLFNKGEGFEWPERVPFRLTHNMEAAMGPLKHEGMYRKSCEAVMRALRAQTAALMSVIGPFVYDPLIPSRGSARPVDCGERTNAQAMQNLQHIKQRLNGMVRTKKKQLSLSLSPEGQVEHLIVEATSVENLCQMYIGWGPFL